MRLTDKFTINITCDRCGQDETDSLTGGVVLAAKAWRESGWRIGDKEVVCPECLAPGDLA